MRAWNGPLFDRFLQFRPVIVDSLAKHGDAALTLHPPGTGARVVDVGCGFGDASRQIAELVGPEGSVLGVDVAERFIEAAREECAGFPNVRFHAADVEAEPFEDTFDYAFSRFGTMFFANPVAALRNIREALVPGGRLCMVVWRQKPDNEWTYQAEVLVKSLIERPDDSDEPTCGPGPFSMANADTVTGQLLAAGFEDIELRRFDMQQLMGRDLDEAIALVTALGPAGEVLRLAGDRADHLRPQVEQMLRDGLAEYVQDDGSVRASASTWIVSATA
jgi:SAM-dependent methyltransferase